MFRKWMIGSVSALVAAMAVQVHAQDGESLFDRAPWTISAGPGFMKFEGDEEVEDGFFIDLRAGYDFNPRWTVEGDLWIAPSLENRVFDDDRFALEDSIYAFGLSAEVLLHLRNTEDLHFDPFLSLGAGVNIYEEDLGGGEVELIGRGGGGIFFHFNDQLALRGDLRTGLVGEDTEAKLIGSIGLTYRLGAAVPAKYEVSGGDLDSDGDGLLDSHEAEIGTDPYNPDTDDDGLSDGEEVNLYRTNPLDNDSDLDGLKDGAEVRTYETNPLEQDTDKGGVLDGHEVIEDGTDPLDPSDDLQLFTLNIEFDYDKAVIRPSDYPDLDVVLKALNRAPNSTARVEGHADKRKSSKRDYNLRLSERRAKAVVEYLINIGGIDAARLSYEGYGFDRPKVPNDTETNMQINRRVEVYIRRDGMNPGGDEGATLEIPGPADAAGSATTFGEMESLEPPVK